MTIALHEAVLSDDLPAIFASIARDNPPAADRLLEAVQATFDQLLRQAESGVRYSTRNPRLRDVRMLPVHQFPNYLVFYRIDRDALRILVHGARHLSRLFQRQPPA